jgi:3-methyladenine DNA glycosylase/8-oxoguanine DNA glycosylase
VTSAAVRDRQLDHIRSQQEVLAIAEEWRPYRSLATTDLLAAAFEPAEVASAARLRSP